MARITLPSPSGTTEPSARTFNDPKSFPLSVVSNVQNVPLSTSPGDGSPRAKTFSESPSRLVRDPTSNTTEIAPVSPRLGPDGKPRGIAPAATLQDGHRPLCINIGTTVDRIIEIISRYLYQRAEDQFEATGRNALAATVSRYVEKGEKMELVFPGFPFKSPSRKKVLGVLPDLAEEILLRRLEMLARTIEDYHAPGAVVRVVSDGVVYGELLGQSYPTVYQYNEELRRLSSRLSLTHITFVRAVDLLNTSSGISEDILTEVDYVHSIPDVRARFLAHEVRGFDLEVALKQDHGTLLTYRGYLKFLEADLEGSPLMNAPDGKVLSKTGQEKARRLIAKAMLRNGAKFSDLVALKFPHAIRLSVHAHNNAGPKYAFNMFPDLYMCASPWHNTLVEKADGSLISGHLNMFDPSAYEVVHRYGRPYFLREHSVDFNFGDRINPHVSFVRNFPFGVTVKADPRANLSFNDLPMQKVRALAIHHSLILFQGFSQVDREDLRQKAREFGDVVSWPAYGDIFEVKDNPSIDINSSLTCEAMPMHYDGVFKTKKGENGELTHDPPHFQIFQCIQAPGVSEGGRTLLTNTVDLIRHGLTPSQREKLSDATWSVFTPQNKAFGGDFLKLPLIMRNEKTGHDVLRWHERWPQYVTKYKGTDVFITGVSRSESTQIGDHLTDLLYDRRFCYAHTWATGEFLISDNIETMHTRTAFKPSPRELWRIHVN